MNQRMTLQRPSGTTTSGASCRRQCACGSHTTAGGPPFTLGGPSGNSPVLSGPRPGARNRFWDFHTTHVRPPTVSVLHDPARNPGNLDTCSTVCNQEYRCGGNPIGTHRIQRTYTKGRYNRQDVTLMDVTKT